MRTAVPLVPLPERLIERVPHANGNRPEWAFPWGHSECRPVLIQDATWYPDFPTISPPHHYWKCACCGFWFREDTVILAGERTTTAQG